MPLQIPDFVGHQLAREQGTRNQMALESNLKSQALQQQQTGMQNQEMARGIQKRNELEMLLQHTAPEEQDRAAFEWSRANDPELYGKLQARAVVTLQQLMAVNPEQAAQQFNRMTGEQVQYDPTSGIRFIPLIDGSKLAVTPHGVTHVKPEQTEDDRVREAGRKAAAEAAGRAMFPTPSVQKDEKVGETVTPQNKKIATYKRPDGSVYQVEIGPARPQAALITAAGGDLSPDDIEAAAQAVIEGRIYPSQLSAMYGSRSNVKARIMKRVMQKDPTYDAAAAEAGRTAGDKNQKQIRALDAAEESLKEVERTSQAFKRGEFGIMNDIILKGKVQLNNPRAIEFQTAVNSVIDDLASALSGGGSTTDAARKQATKLFNDGYSQGGLRHAIAVVRAQLAARRAAFARGTKYERTPGTGGAAVWTPEDEQRLQELEAADRRRKGVR